MAVAARILFLTLHRRRAQPSHMETQKPGPHEETPPNPGFFSDPRYGQNRKNLAGAIGFSTIILAGGLVLLLLPQNPSKSSNPVSENTAPVESPSPTPKGPGEARLLRDVARDALARRDATTAETSLRQALALEPDHAASWSNLGVALMLQKRTDEALEAIDKAISLDAGMARTHANRSHILRSLGRLPDAIDSLSQATETDPSSAIHANRLLLLRIENGEMEYVRQQVITARSMRIPSLERQTIVAGAAVAAIDGDYPSAISLLARARQMLDPEAVHDLLDDPVFAPHMTALITRSGPPSPKEQTPTPPGSPH